MPYLPTDIPGVFAQTLAEQLRRDRIQHWLQVDEVTEPTECHDEEAEAIDMTEPPERLVKR